MVETKLSGRTVGSTLIVVAAKARDGSVTQVIPGQSFKLFMASRLTSISKSRMFEDCFKRQLTVLQLL